MLVDATSCPRFPPGVHRNTLALRSSNARQCWSGFGTKRIVASSFLSGDASLQLPFASALHSGESLCPWANAFVSG